MKQIDLSLEQARHLGLSGHGLYDAWDLPADRSGAAEVVERLGYVQIDTIAVVERAHHHMLWSRHSAYQPQMLDDLLAIDRRVFEYWHHAACYLPMRDYRFSLPLMRGYQTSKASLSWIAKHREVIDEVLARIREEGGLRSADFRPPEGFVRGTWWSRTPYKIALETLFDRGELMITAREGFQRRYDLRERVLPDWVDLREPEPDEIGRHYALQNLRRMGVLQERDMTRPRMHREAISAALKDMLAEGEVVEAQISGLDNGPRLCLAESLDRADEPDGEAHILSPFDPLTIQRRWLRELFGFDYALECYLPKDKRVHGYFSLPLLWGARFAGRIDAKADRRPRHLLLRHVELEEPYELSPDFIASLALACWRFASFNECGEAVIVERTTPESLAEPLKEALAAHAPL